MSGRKLLAGALTAALPGWTILSHARQLDVLTKPTCVLWTDKREKAPALGLAWFRDEVTLWVLTAADLPALVEDDLDGNLYEVMQALEPLNEYAWGTAERDVLAESFDGYKLTVTCVWQMLPDVETEEENP